MADTVRITTGGLSQRFSFALPAAAPVFPVTTAPLSSAPLYKDGLHSTYQAYVRGTSGTVTATVNFYATNDPHAAGADDAEDGTRNNFQINTTNTSTAVTSAEGLFRSDMTGDEVYATGVPAGTTFTYVSPASGTLSAAATATGTPQARFQSTDWVLLGTVTLSGTLYAFDGFATMAAWKWSKAVVSAISGTGATVYARQGV